MIAQERVKELEPKAAFHDAVEETVNTITIRNFAKLLKTGEQRFRQWLKDMDILNLDGMPRQIYLDNGYFSLKESTYFAGSARCSYTQTRVTGKGQTYLQKRYSQFMENTYQH